MTPQLDVIGIVVTDMSASVAFYRRLGLDFPEGSSNSRTPKRPCPTAYG